MPQTKDFSTELSDTDFFGEGIKLKGQKAKLSTAATRFAGMEKKLTALLSKNKDMFSVKPLPVRIKCTLTIPADNLKNIPYIDMGPFLEAIVTIYAAYKNDVRVELDRLMKWIEKNQKMSLVIPAEEIKDQLDKTKDKIARILKPFEKDLEKGVSDALVLEKRKSDKYENGTVTVDVKPKPMEIEIVPKGTLEGPPQMTGMASTKIPDRDLWKDSEGGKDDAEHIAPPQFKVSVTYGIEKGVDLFLKRNSSLAKKLEERLLDVLDKWMLQTVKAIRFRFKKLDKAAGEGGNEYRMELRVWLRASQALIRKLKTGIETGMASAYEDFVDRELKSVFGGAFKGTRFAVRCVVVAGTMKMKEARKAEAGVMTPKDLADTIDQFCADHFKGNDGIVRLTKESDDKNRKLVTFIAGVVKTPLPTDEKEKEKEKKKKSNDWSKLNTDFSKSVEASEKMAEKLKKAGEKLGEKLHEMAENMTDKARIRAIEKTEKQWKEMLEKCDKLLESIDEDQSYLTKSIKSEQAFEKGSDYWNYTNAKGDGKTKDAEIYKGHLLSVEMEEIVEDVGKQLKKSAS